ncbi:hypothetical protein QZH41_013159, partial [Actinostola sp. cb2023]
PEALKIYNGMSFDAPEDKDKLDAVIKKFDQYTIGETNETYESLTPLIGSRAAQQMKLITVNKENFVSVTAPKRDEPEVNQLLTVEKIVQEYSDVFESQVGSFPEKVHLEVDEDVKPTVTPTRRIPTALKEKFKQELDRLEELGVIAQVDKPTPW